MEPVPTASAPSGSDADAGAVYYTCQMHSQVHLAAPGTCPICGMPLVPRKAGGSPSPPMTMDGGM
jgi:Cu(I)/Ag(I) efflux system membrane fusion protein